MEATPVPPGSEDDSVTWTGPLFQPNEVGDGLTEAVVTGGVTSVLMAKATLPKVGGLPRLISASSGSVSGTGTFPAAMAVPNPGSNPMAAFTASETWVSRPMEEYSGPRLPENRVTGAGSEMPTSWKTPARLMTSLRSPEVASQWNTGESVTSMLAAPGRGLASLRLAVWVSPALPHCSSGMAGPVAGPLTPRIESAPPRPRPPTGMGARVMVPST